MKRENLIPKIFLILSVLAVVTVQRALAQDANTFLEISPVIIDEKAEARDVIPESVSITSRVNYKANIYAFVNNVNPEEGEEKFLDPSKADYSDSLANWIEISRGVVELLPGETKKIDFEIRVNLNAKPGIYHAIVSLSVGSTRDEAESRIASAPSVMINVEVKEDIKEVLQLSKFQANKKFFVAGPVDLSYELKNEGNRAVDAVGEIRIYDKNGREVTSLGLDDNSAVGVGTASVLGATWDQIKGFGQYKAVLDLRYGENGKSSVQDTMIFWYLPWQIIVSAVALVLILTVLVPVFAYRRRLSRDKAEISLNRSSPTGLWVESPKNVSAGSNFNHRVIDLRKNAGP